MNLFEKELRSMFGNVEQLKDSKCYGNYFIARLDDELRVKIQFVTGGISGHYTGIETKIINRTEGLVDSQRIKFSDVIGFKSIGHDKIEPYIWDYQSRVDWYTPVTATEKKNIAEAVLDYISVYQSEDMGMKFQ